MSNPSTPAAASALPSPSLSDRRDELFGHPKGLYVLFFTELWERFSFYGMKAILMLYMLNHMLWSQRDASHVMAWYTGLIYATPLLGGILADKVLGARWSVFIGGCLMAVGNFLLVVEGQSFFYGGLIFLIVGCGLLKPNISTQVGSLYRADDPRRDSAFTIFYMGINLGAMFAPVVCDWLRLRVGYGVAFGAAGVGMAIGLLVYLLGMRVVMERVRLVAGHEKGGTGSATGDRPVANETPRNVVRDRIVVLIVIFVFVIVFWMAFEQAANVMTVWADKHTNLYAFRAEAPPAVISDEPAAARPAAGFAFGAGQLQAVNPFFVVTLAVVFSWLWVWLAKRGRQPSTPTKMCLGFLGMTLAYGVMMAAAQRENRPTEAPLAALPSGINLGDYGSTRLQYDSSAKVLKMDGVLTDLDWLRLLGASAHDDYRRAVQELVEGARKRAEKAGREEKWEERTVLPADTPQPKFVEPLPKDVSWNAETRTLTASGAVGERERLSLEAAGADPTFREAVDRIYQNSSVLKVTVWWLILFYLLCTMGELCLSPVGLSLVTKMAPPKHVGLFMGLWFVTTGGVANYAAHSIGGWWGAVTPTQYFLMFGAMAAIATVLMFLVVGALRARMHGIH